MVRRAYADDRVAPKVSPRRQRSGRAARAPSSPRCDSGVRGAGSTAGHALCERALVGRSDRHGYVRSAEDSPQPWRKSSHPRQDVGRARFRDKAFERAESDQTKQVCTGLFSWDGEHGYSARLVVKYVIAPAAARSRTRSSCRLPGWRSSANDLLKSALTQILCTWDPIHK